MKSGEPGLDTSPVEVTNISKHGFWLLLEERELFLPFSEFSLVSAGASLRRLECRVPPRRPSLLARPGDRLGGGIHRAS